MENLSHNEAQPPLEGEPVLFWERKISVAMLACTMLGRTDGCTRTSKLCEDEMAVAIDCPGQDFRTYRRRVIRDPQIDTGAI